MPTIRELVAEHKAKYPNGMIADDWFELYPWLTFQDLRDLEEMGRQNALKARELEIEFIKEQRPQKFDKDRITDQDIDQARQVPIENVIGIPPSGRALFFTRSPFREERTPSFCIYKNSNSYYDYGSSEGGDVINLVEKLHGYDFLNAVKFLIGK